MRVRQRPRSLWLLLLMAMLASVSRPQHAAAQGIVRISVGTSLGSLDPARTSTGEEYIYDNLVFNGLTRMRADLSIEPDLAETWDYTPDLKSWTFHLRHGVRFHNGREMTAEDVIATFKHILDPATGSPPRSNYDMIEKMTAVDDHTVRFDLKYPYGGFADILSDRQVKIVPHDLIAALPTQPVGTGPFAFKSYTPGDRLVLVRNPTYWEAGAPKLDGAELRIIPEMSARIAALQAGDLDIIWDLPPEQVKSLSQNAKLRVESVATPSWDAAIMNNAIPPFNDLRVRRAFHVAVDKRDVVESVLFGQGAPTLSPIPPTHPFFNKDIPFGKADPAAARKLLAEAGHPNGITVPLIVPGGRPVRERLGVVLQQLAKPGGFDIEIRTVPFSQYSAEVSGKAPFYIDGYFARPTIDTALYAFYHTGDSWNVRLWNFSDKRVDEVLDKARLTGDPAQQKPLYLAFQQYVAEDDPSFIAYAVNFICAYRKEVQGVKTHPMRWFDLRATTIAR